MLLTLVPSSFAESAIGVSRVAIPSKGEGAKGANLPSVPLDTSGWQATSVWNAGGGSDSAAKGNSGPNGFFGGGESKKDSDKLFIAGKKDASKTGVWKRMVDRKSPSEQKAMGVLPEYLPAAAEPAA